MKIARFRYDGKIYRGYIEDGKVFPFDNNDLPLGVDIGRVKLLAPCVPSKIVAAGLNYKDHAEELGLSVPAEPVIFIKPSTSVIGPDDEIICPRTAKRVDYEAELGVVIKKLAKNVPKERVFDVIEGYTCFNDVTARDLQEKDSQWTRSKSFDTFAPIGPWIVTDIDPGDIRIRSLVNGQTKQESRTSLFIFSVAELVEFISRVMTLLPGDVIATGTPPKVGPIRPGDVVTIEIDGIGKLVNKVVLEKS